MDDQETNQPLQPSYQPPVTPYQAPQPTPGFQASPAPVATPAYEVPYVDSIETEPSTTLFTPSPQPEFAATPPPAPKKKKFLIGGIIAGAAILLVGGGILAYNLWYQNPQKVVTDALIHAIEAKTATYTGSIVVSGDTKMTVALDGGYGGAASNTNATVSFDASGTTYKLGASLLFDNQGNAYFKLKDVDQLAKAYSGQLPPAAQTTLNKIVAKVNNKWVKISADDLKSYSEAVAKAGPCLSDTIKKFQSDSKLSNEVGTIYQKHMFIQVDKKLGSKDGSLGYSLSSNPTAAQAFAEDFKNTQVYKDLHNCDSSFTIDTPTMTPASTPGSSSSLEMWVSRWGHDVTKVVLANNAGSTKTLTTIEPKFNTPVTITTPKDTITLKDLSAELQSALMATTTSADMGVATQANATANETNAAAVTKKAEVYSAVTNTYPTFSQLMAGTVAEAKLDPSLSTLLSATAPTAAHPTTIQYVPCGSPITGAHINYFDPSSSAVMSMTAGICKS